MNGYTPPISIQARLTNLAATTGRVALLEAAAESNGDPHECERILTAKAYQAQASANALDIVGMIDRRDAITEYLSDENLSPEQISELWDELLKLQSLIDGAADDLADMRRENKFGFGL